MSLDRRNAEAKQKLKAAKCSRHFNQNGNIPLNEQIYTNNMVTAECNKSESNFFFSNISIDITVSNIECMFRIFR